MGEGPFSIMAERIWNEEGSCAILASGAERMKTLDRITFDPEGFGENLIQGALISVDEENSRVPLLPLRQA